MKNLKCKNCEGVLEKTGKVNLHCHDCNLDYTVQSFCNTCGDELEYLVACGAVDFWCNTCNELKSKSSAIYRLV